MPRKVIIGQLSTKSKEVRDEFIKKMSAVGSFAFQSEPGVLKYAAFVPRDESDQTTVFAVEEYKDEAAFESHLAEPGVKALIEWIGTGKVLEGAPRILDLQYVDDFYFSRGEVSKHEDPCVVIAELDYKPDTVQKSIPYWKAVADTGREKEAGTLVYGILRDPKEQNKLFTVEAYDSKEYLLDVHAKSKAVEESIKNTKHLREGLKHHFLKIQGGFLYKD